MNKKSLRVVLIVMFCSGLLQGCSSARIEPAGQPRMEAALASLQDARAQLQMAAHNKGGHRLEAIRLIDRAIDEVDRGIQAGEKY